MSEARQLADRVMRLEGQNRRLRLLTLSAFVFAAIPWLTGLSVSPQQVVTARKFVLVDESGLERLVMGFSEEGTPNISLGEVGKPPDSYIHPGGIILSGTRNSRNVGVYTGSLISMTSLANSTKFEVSIDTKSLTGIGPRLTLRGPENRQVILGRTQLVTEQTGSVELRPTSSITFLDSEGDVVWKAP